jgi:type 1 glutamine amidotransferase
MSFISRRLAAVGAAVCIVAAGFFGNANAAAVPRFQVLVLAEERPDDQHYPMVEAAKKWLTQLCADSAITYSLDTNPNKFTDTYLANYKVIIQLNYPPFMWTSAAQAAFQRYIEQGKGGWIGLHHAALYSTNVLGTGQSLVAWFGPFLGGITYQNYMAGRASGSVRVEDSLHPCMKGVPKNFTVVDDEWYTWSPDPRSRSRIHVLANVDENSYVCKSASDKNVKMGDHPVVWVDDSAAYKGRNVYIFMGHSDSLFLNTAWTRLFRNSIFWVAGTGATGIGKGSLHISPLRGGLTIQQDGGSIVLRNESTNRIDVSLIDAKGRVAWNGSGSDGACRIARRALASGVYAVRAKSERGVFLAKICLN